MGILPFLSVNARQRFDVDASGALQPPDGFPGKSPLMAILTPILMHKVHNISPVAKLDSNGRAVEKWNYELPPMEVTAMLVNLYRVQGVAPKGQPFPYALKAIGPVDAHKIMAGGRGLVSENVVIVP